MEDLEVSLVKYLCPVCGKEADEGIIMNSILTEAHAKEVKKLHNKAIGFAKHVCEECGKYKDKVVYFIGINPEKSEKDNLYRTGQIVGIKKEAPLVEHVKNYIQTIEDGSQMAFIDESAGHNMGLW